MHTYLQKNSLGEIGKLKWVAILWIFGRLITVLSCKTTFNERIVVMQYSRHAITQYSRHAALCCSVDMQCSHHAVLPSCSTLLSCSTPVIQFSHHAVLYCHAALCFHSFLLSCHPLLTCKHKKVMMISDNTPGNWVYFKFSAICTQFPPK